MAPLLTKALMQYRLSERIAEQIKARDLGINIDVRDIVQIVSLAETLTDSVFIVSERHELDGAAWFDPVAAFHTRAEADRDAERRQTKAMVEFVKEDDDDWRRPAHRVTEVFFGGRTG